MIKRNYFILLLLALIFAAPGLIAYGYYLNPQWLSLKTTNEGKLLKPPVLVNAIKDGKKKWRFVLWYPQHCEAACLQKIDELARVRLALGRHLYEVDEWVLLNENSSMVLSLEILQEQDIHLARLSKENISSVPILAHKPQLFIANPQGYLVLAYEKNAKPQAIYHDIKRLLSTKQSE